MPITVSKVFLNDYLQGYKSFVYTINPEDWVAENGYFKYRKEHDLATTNFIVDTHIVGDGDQALVGGVRTTTSFTIYWNNNTTQLRVKLLRPQEASDG